jgi:hypothetical protein
MESAPTLIGRTAPTRNATTSPTTPTRWMDKSSPGPRKVCVGGRSPVIIGTPPPPTSGPSAVFG